MFYDEVKYWNRRNNPNSATEAATKTDIEFIKKNLIGCRNILDLGPGVGRIFAAYEAMISVEGYDISSLYRARAIKESAKYGFDLNITVGDSIGRLPYADKEFDAAVASSVFLHQKPSRIVGVMGELARVVMKVIAISWFEPERHFDGDIYDDDAYCFNYNYPKMCDDNGWLISDVITDGRRIWFVYGLV